MSAGALRIGLVQQTCGEDPDDNLARSAQGVRAAADRGAQLVLLPELHRYRYFCQVEDPEAFALAETVPGDTTRRLGGLAKELGLVIVASVFERRAAGVYHNTAVAIDSNGELAGRYRKMHIPDDPGYQEKYYFTPGDLGFRPVKTSVGMLGLLVCWDQWYPEAARLMCLAGADLLLYPTAIGWDPAERDPQRQRELDAWRTIQRAHAVANAVPVAACNRVGLEPHPADSSAGIQFWGHSFICGPQGEVLTEAGQEDAVLTTDLDLTQTEALRQSWPYWRDRRIDAYADLLKRYRD